jgi:hypothetical protein
MIELIPGAPPEGVRSGKVLKMVENPRMGGSVPAWVKADSVKDEIAGNLATAQNTDNSFKAALSYQMQQPQKQPDEEFSFFDLLDMVNPLQHIPLINIAYRKLTGDEIKSAPQIIGGAIFGGPAGAAGGLVNAIVKEETGKDIADNALGIFSGEKPELKKTLSNDPEKRLADALSGQAQDDLPVSLLAFTSRGVGTGYKVEKTEAQTQSFSPYEIY